MDNTTIEKKFQVISDMMDTLVMKFGGAAVAHPDDFSRIAEMIIARAEHKRLIIVVSAMGGKTDELIALANKVNPNPPQREYDMLVTVGERISISLLAMAIAAKKREAVSFTGSQSGIITCDRHTDARIVDVKPFRILSSLEVGKIVIVAGFQGVSRGGEITTLGRGGSDTTAVALGVALGASKVEFFKDVPGIFMEDPKKNPAASLISCLSYEQALDLTRSGAKVLNSRCVELAKNNYLPLHVRTFKTEGSENLQGTWIGEKNRRNGIKPVFEIDAT